ncbi:MAG: copper transporter [Candidatus Aquicultor sp.]|nr:copper transporter [Candidatus Aquicultor sp.]
MFDMRYHIASLVAVFIALAIGILLGTVIDDKGMLLQQQQSLVKRIETNFNTLRDENRTLKVELDEEKKLTSGVYPLSIMGRLDGQNVVVLATSKKQNEMLSVVVDGLSLAGATVGTVKVKEDFELTDEVKRELAAYLPQEMNDDNVRELVLKKLAEELVATDTATAATTTTSPVVPYLSRLSELGLIVMETDASKSITSALILGGTDGDLNPKTTDVHIIAALKGTGIRVVGAENRECKKSYMKEYQQAGIPTVDNIDTQAGIISAVFALREANGNFGVKATADQLVPKV